MLLREQDFASFKEAKKQHEKHMKRMAKKQEKAQSKIQGRIKTKGGSVEAERIEIEVPSKSASPVKQDVDVPEANGGPSSGDGQGVKEEKKDEEDFEVTDGTDFKKTQRDKSFDSSSLWQPVGDTGGKPKKWKNKLTGETRRTKTKPAEGKSAILADDVSSPL